MKAICISDVHLSPENPEARLDNLVDVQFDKFKFVFDTAKKENAIVLQAGDLCHKPRSWMLLPLLIDFLKRYPEVKMYSVRGQHDDYMFSEETKDRTILGVLVKAGLVIPLGDKPIEVQGVSLYGANFGQNLPEIKRSSRTSFSIGVIHSSISDAPLWLGHQFTSADKFLDLHPGYDFILVGDIHRKFKTADEGDHILLNTGPMLRREATEYNFQHNPSVFLLDTDDCRKNRWISIPHAKAASVLSRDHIERQAEAETLLDDFVVAIKNDAGDVGVSFSENLHAFYKANEIDEKVVEAIARFIERSKKEEL
jgi:hypothetical protein